MARHPPLRSRSVETPVVDAPSIDDRFAQLSAQFDVLKIQVRQAQQLSGLGTAAAMIAHEVNNLLTPILSYADYALATDDAQLARKALTVTVRNARMLIAMSDRILELGAAKPQRRESVVVRQAVEEALASMCRELSKDGIDFAMNIGDSLTVFADPLQLRQVLFNLFLNAREAMAPNHSGRLTVSAHRVGRALPVNQSRDRERADHPSRERERPDGIEVRSEKSEDRSPSALVGDSQSAIGIGQSPNHQITQSPNHLDLVVLEIRNTGSPIAPELLSHIFEPFQTSKPIRREGKGRCSGLGLALVRDLVEENDGTISVASDETSTTFVICLPRADNT
jgi:signal transduction histidine kinase